MIIENMIISTIVAACVSEPEIFNLTQEKFDENDKILYERALDRCGELYTDAPCLSKFFKYYTKEGSTTYYATCTFEESK